MVRRALSNSLCLLVFAVMLCLASSTEAAIHVLQANLDVGQEGRTQPPNTSVPPPPSGVAIMVYDDATNTFDLQMSANGLTLADTTSPVYLRDSHIHYGAPLSAGGVAGPVIHGFGTPARAPFAPWTEPLPGFLHLTLDDQVFTRAEETNPATGRTFEQDLLLNLTYLNLHSNRNPGGEIRGQLIVIPEPATMSVLGLGALALLARRRNA